jgi:hypothetical protein
MYSSSVVKSKIGLVSTSDCLTTNTTLLRLDMDIPHASITVEDAVRASLGSMMMCLV